MGLASKMAAANAGGGGAAYGAQPGQQQPPYPGHQSQQQPGQYQAYPGQQQQPPYPGGAGGPVQQQQYGQGQSGFPVQPQPLQFPSQYPNQGPPIPQRPQQHGQQYAVQPPAAQYDNPNYSNNYGSQQQNQQYSQSPRPSVNQYQAAPQGQAANPQMFRQSLQDTIQEKNLHNMFQNPQILDQICSTAPQKVDQLCQAWRVPREVGQDIVKLGLFDIILFLDDSGSMRFEENGERIDDMKLIISKAAFAGSLFDADGIQVRFMNSNQQGNNIRSEQEVEAMVAQAQFKGLTPMGTQLKAKVLDPLVVQPARANQLKKPVLVIVVTDGQPAGEPEGAVFEAVKYASNELSRTPCGKGAISFQFAQVGNDLKAREFLGKLDNEPGIGELVDCTSNFEVEQDEMSRAVPPLDLTPELWLLKLLLGAIDSSYDTKDEGAGSRRPTQAPSVGGYQQQQYGAPPGPPPQGQYQQQGQYGAPPQGQYGAPQQGQYGAPSQGQYGAPPQGQYGQQSQYGAPPQGQYGASQQGQYGAPPPGGAYPGQSQYNPKPPPRY